MSPTVAEVIKALSRFSEIEKNKSKYLQMAIELLEEE